MKRTALSVVIGLSLVLLGGAATADVAPQPSKKKGCAMAPAGPADCGGLAALLLLGGAVALRRHRPRG